MTLTLTMVNIITLTVICYKKLWTHFPLAKFAGEFFKWISLNVNEWNEFEISESLVILIIL